MRTSKCDLSPPPVVLTAILALTHDSRGADFKKSGPLVIDGKADLTISGLEIANPEGHGITIRNARRIRIEHCNIGPCKGEAVNIDSCDRITVTGNRFEAVSTGVYALDSRHIEVTHVRWFNKRGIENPCWDAGNCGTVAGWDDNDWHADLNDEILPRDLLGEY
jgi:hypothetical protein